MTKNRLTSALLLGSLATSACATTDQALSVNRLLADPAVSEGKIVQVRGKIEVTHGLVNLFSKDGEQCVGLLTFTRDRQKYEALAGRLAVVVGTFEADGCGRKGICDEHLCGPAILSDVRLP